MADRQNIKTSFDELSYEAEQHRKAVENEKVNSKNTAINTSPFRDYLKSLAEIEIDTKSMPTIGVGMKLEKCEVIFQVKFEKDGELPTEEKDIKELMQKLSWAAR